MSHLDDITTDISGAAGFYSDFAETATATGGTFSVVFDIDPADIELDDGLIVSASAISCWCRSSDAISYAPVGAALTIRSVSYVVIDSRTNDSSETLLVLNET